MTGQDQEFFSKLRSHTRWVFIAAAVVIVVVFVVAALR